MRVNYFKFDRTKPGSPELSVGEFPMQSAGLLTCSRFKIQDSRFNIFFQRNYCWWTICNSPMDFTVHMAPITNIKYRH